MRPRTAVAVAFTSQAVGVGTVIGTLSLFVKPVSEGLGVSLAAISFGPSLIYLMLAVSGMVVGPWLDRGHIRSVMLVGGAVVSLGLLAASRSTSLAELGVICIATGFCLPMIGPLTGSSLVGKVVTEGRGQALGTLSIGAPAGGAAFALVAGFVIESFGWRTAWALFSVVVAAVILPMVVLFVPRRIRSSEEATPMPAGPAGPRSGAEAPGTQRRELLRTRDYLAMAVAQGAFAGSQMGWAFHVAPFLQGLGASTALASLVLAAGAALGVSGGLFFGWLVDRVSPRLVMLCLMITASAGYFALSLEMPLRFTIPCAFAVSFAAGGAMPSYTTLLTSRFGAASIGRALGMTNLFMLPFGFGIPPIAGAVVTATGSYAPALVGIACVLAFGALALTRLRSSAPEGGS